MNRETQRGRQRLNKVVDHSGQITRVEPEKLIGRRATLGLLAILLSAAANGQRPMSPLTQTPAESAAKSYAADVPQMPSIKLAPQDLIDVEVFDTPELSANKLRISADGYIDMPVAGKLNVAGMTPIEASEAVAKLLKDDQIMLDPRVTILVLEYPTEGVSVLGEVNKPGTYLLLGRHSLYEALSQAGGITQRSGATIVLTHVSDPTHAITIPVDSPNYSERQRLTSVEPGDVIVVSRADSIFVVGDVNHAGEFPVVSGKKYTTLDAVALASGATHTAKLEKASIVRDTGDGTIVTIPINLKKIAENKDPDQVLLPGDVLVIPRSGIRQFLDYALPNATGALAGAVGAAIIYR
jgi:polysaccharide export outer membrane protein